MAEDIAYQIMDQIQRRMQDYPGTSPNSQAMRVFEESDSTVFYPIGKTALEVVDNLFYAFKPGNYFMSCVTSVSKSDDARFFAVTVMVIRK